MKTIRNTSTLRGLVGLGAVALIAVAIGMAGCKSSPDRTSGQKMSDKQVARAVKKSLADDPTFKYSNVSANVYAGTIQLTGFVETPEQRLRAAELAAKTKGARQVINEIMLRPMPTGPVTIRDPLGHETGRLLVDTNMPIPQMRNLPPSETAPQQPGQSPSPTGEGTTPK